MDGGQAQGHKKSKSYYRKCGRKFTKQTRMLQVGMKGVLITCAGFESRCVQEAYNLLNEYADKLYGPDTSHEETSQIAEEDSDEDISESLQKEVNELNQQCQKKERRFQSVRTGAKNVIFIQAKGVDPHKVVSSLLTDLEQSKTPRARQIQRMLPISHTCRAFEEKIETTAREMFTQYFHAPEAKDSSFCVMVKARNNNSVQKSIIIQGLASSVMQDGPHQHRVDFDDPNFTVMVEIIGGVCCLSVLQNYSRFKKYNLYLIAKGNDPDVGGKRKRTDGDGLGEGNGDTDREEKHEKRLKNGEPQDNDASSGKPSPPSALLPTATSLIPVSVSAASPPSQSSLQSSQPVQEHSTCAPSSAVQLDEPTSSSTTTDSSGLVGVSVESAVILSDSLGGKLEAGEYATLGIGERTASEEVCHT